MRYLFGITPLFFLSALFLSGCSSSSSKPEKNLVKAPDLPEGTILQNGIATYDEGLFKVSLASWSELRDGYPTSYFSTLAEMKIADAHFFSGDYPSALVAYEEFAKLHPGHEAMPYVRYQIGNCSFKQFKDVMHDQAPLQTALKSYEQLIVQHPKSEYVVLARRQIDRCKELQAAYEKYVADFYSRKGLDAAAKSRINKLSVEFPGSKALSVVKEQQGLEDLGTIKTEISPAGKIPSAPKMVLSSQLDQAHYSKDLQALKGKVRNKEAVIEETSITSELGTSKTLSSTNNNMPEQNAAQKELIEFTCEESSNGAVFMLTTTSTVMTKPKSMPSILNFSWGKANSSLERETQTELCSAGGLTVAVTGNNSGLSFNLPAQDSNNFNFIVLNRPNRVVLTLISE